MKRFLCFSLLAMVVATAAAQTDNVGVGTNTPTTRLTVNGAISSTPSSAAAAAAVTIPANVSIFRLTAVAGVQANVLSAASPQEGQYLTIYNQDDNAATFAGVSIAATNGVGSFVYLNGGWRLAANAPAPASPTGWSTTGNAGTNPAVNFVGTTDAQPLVVRTNNTDLWKFTTDGRLEFTNGLQNVSVGKDALNATMGANNVAVGTKALQNTTTGALNTALGHQALRDLTTAQHNTAVGGNALRNNTADGNTAMGSSALMSNTTGHSNTANGYDALRENTTGDFNTASGEQALVSNTTGWGNTATGYQALRNNTTGNNNTAIGQQALKDNTAGQNTAVGAFAALMNTSGGRNTAVGYSSLQDNTDGTDNTAVGHQSQEKNNGIRNTSLGSSSLRDNIDGFDNTALGAYSLQKNTTGQGNVAVGTMAIREGNGSFNVAVGSLALSSFIPGGTAPSRSVGIGYNAGRSNSLGFGNVSIGYQARPINLSDPQYALAIGYEARSGDHSLAIGRKASANGTAIAIGDSAQTTSGGISFGASSRTITGLSIGVLAESDNSTSLGHWSSTFDGSVAVGSFTFVTTANKVRLGNSSILVVEGQVPYSFPSDGRFKFSVKSEDVKGLEFIKKLRPVNYNFNTREFQEFMMKNANPKAREEAMKSLDFTKSSSIRHTGFIAQEVEQAAKEAGYDFDGLHVPENENDNYSLAYSQFVVPLVKAVQEQQQLIEQLQKKIADLEKIVNK